MPQQLGQNGVGLPFELVIGGEFFKRVFDWSRDQGTKPHHWRRCPVHPLEPNVSNYAGKAEQALSGSEKSSQDAMYVITFVVYGNQNIESND